MKIINVACVFLLVIPAVAFSQTKDKNTTTKYLYHSPGISFQKFKHLNQRVATNAAYEPAGNSVATFQFGMLTETNKLQFNTAFTAGSNFKGKKSTRSTNMRMLDLSLDLGYDVLQQKRFSIAPFLGLGLASYSVSYYRDLSSIPFDSVLSSTSIQSQTKALTFTNTFINYRGGVNVAVKSAKNQHSSIALQVGYSGSFTANDWKINSFQTLANAPEDRLSKVFTNLVFRYQFGLRRNAFERSSSEDKE